MKVSKSYKFKDFKIIAFVISAVYSVRWNFGSNFKPKVCIYNEFSNTFMMNGIEKYFLSGIILATVPERAAHVAVIKKYTAPLYLRYFWPFSVLNEWVSNIYIHWFSKMTRKHCNVTHGFLFHFSLLCVEFGNVLMLHFFMNESKVIHFPNFIRPILYWIWAFIFV